MRLHLSVLQNVDRTMQPNTAVTALFSQIQQQYLGMRIDYCYGSALILIGIGLTAQMFIQLYTDYMKGGTTSISSVMLNSSMTLPPSAICIPMNYNTQGEEFAPNGIASTHYLWQDQLSSFINQANLSREMYLDTNSTWSQSMTFMAYLYLRGKLALIPEIRHILQLQTH
jgi:hypothetical protein